MVQLTSVILWSKIHVFKITLLLQYLYQHSLIRVSFVNHKSRSIVSKKVTDHADHLQIYFHKDDMIDYVGAMFLIHCKIYYSISDSQGVMF